MHIPLDFENGLITIGPGSWGSPTRTTFLHPLAKGNKVMTSDMQFASFINTLVKVAFLKASEAHPLIEAQTTWGLKEVNCL